MGSSHNKSPSEAGSQGQPGTVGQVPQPQPMPVQVVQVPAPQPMPSQSMQGQSNVHPVVLAARLPPANQPTNVQQPMQQPQGFVPAQQPTMVPVVPQQPMMTAQQPPMVAVSPQQPMMSSQQPPMVAVMPQQPIQAMPQGQPVYAQQPVQGGYVQ